jgi:hypothetical protein
MTVRPPATRHCVGNCLFSILSAAWVLMYTHKNAQVVTGLQTSCYTNLFTSCRQVVFALLVPSCCKKFGTSCQQLVTSLMALSDLMQGVLYNKSDTVMI